MTSQNADNLEQKLAALTQWEGGKTALWRNALSIAGPAGKRSESLWHRITMKDIPSWALGSIAIAAVFVAAVIINLPSLGVQGESVPVAAKRGAELKGWGKAIDVGSPGIDMWSVVRRNQTTPKQFISPSTTAGPSGGISTAPADAARRQVVRKATIELECTDVRAAYAKAKLIVQPATGEFVQDSGMTGSGKHASANLTLRVAASRLGDVLDALRDLGEVTSQRQEGQDVTGQVVDLEARLRNEKRVEAEILELLDSREDAKLKDILELRNTLKDIRYQIESLTGQRARLGQLVSLATVLVLIRAEDAPEEDSSTLGAYFGDSISGAWHGSLRFLADTVATMLRIIVGGLVFWILAAVVVVLLTRWSRKSAAAQTP